MTAFLILLAAFGADSYGDYFSRGNTAYAQGNFAESIAAYEAVAASGVCSGALFFNLGNAYYEAGDLGRAVLNYERATMVAPADEAARRNLEHALSRTAFKRSRPVGFALDGQGPSPLPGLSQPVLRRGILVIWWLLWGILLFSKRKSSRSPQVTGVLGILLVLCAVGWTFPAPNLQSAVVVTEETPMRYGPDAADVTRVTLAPGDRVLIDEWYGAWARVEIASGERGWIDRSALALIGPPFAGAVTQREHQSQ